MIFGESIKLEIGYYNEKEQIFRMHVWMLESCMYILIPSGLGYK